MRSNKLLTPEQKIDARMALQILSGSGITLSQAAQAALSADGKPPPATPLPWDDLVMSFLADCSRRKRRGATLTYYGTQLGIFSAGPLAARWQQIERPEFRRWLEGLPMGSDSSRAMLLRSVRTAYRYALRQDPPLCAADPTAGIKLDRSREAAPKFFAVADCAAMLAALPAHAVSAVSLQLFAGIRPEEIAPRDPTKARLAWGSVDPVGRIVRVPADVAKTGRARVIEDLPDALWHWLPATVPTGVTWAQSDRSLMDITHRRMPAKWIMRGLRHTFATYALALTSDAGKVAMWLGHEGKPSMLHRHYRGMATRAEAEAFFALRPPRKNNSPRLHFLRDKKKKA